MKRQKERPTGENLRLAALTLAAGAVILVLALAFTVPLR
jgi:hypothetical protein